MQFSEPRLRVLLVSFMLASVLPLAGVRESRAQKLPTDVILVKGAWSSASDSVTPVPEGGTLSDHVYSNPYFGLTYTLSRDWIKKYDGPPPSDSGYYVLALLQPADTLKGAAGGSILIAAEDLFFSPTQAGDALQLINFSRHHLQANYRVTREPTRDRIAGHSFVRFDYVAPAAGLYWHVLATQIRCHIVQFVFTSRDTKLIEKLVQDTATLKLPNEAGVEEEIGGRGAPVCVRDYARDENIVQKVDPFLRDRKYNPIPVRVIIDQAGKVRHIHFLSAFPEQARAITEALLQWEFKPYLRDGRPVEVETGILFGQSPPNFKSPPATVTASTVTR
ncbi:MAG: hypothetical protein JWL65_3901 [Gammaproteobacteria bacterium]|nr:hypothetical protein [Gammaproteobacteria bacterium]